MYFRVLEMLSFVSSHPADDDFCRGLKLMSFMIRSQESFGKSLRTQCMNDCCTQYIYGLNTLIFYILLSSFSSKDLACPGSSVGSPPPSPATWQLQYHLPILSQEGLHCLQKGAKRPCALPCLWHLRLSQRRVLQTAGYLWMCFGKFQKYGHIIIFFF